MRQHKKVLTDGQNVCVNRSRRVSNRERAPKGVASEEHAKEMVPHTDHWTAMLGRFLQPVTSTVTESPW